MQEHTLFISDKAVEDIEDIWAYTAQFSQPAADHLIDRIYNRCSDLLSMPEMGRLRLDLMADIRSSVVEKHSVFYRVLDKRIEIVRVLHTRRDSKKHLGS